MSTNYVCQRCLQTGGRLLGVSSTISLRSPYSDASIPIYAAKRFLSTPRTKSVAELGKKATSRLEKATSKVSATETPKIPQEQLGAAHSIAKELRKRANATTETYIAYGACENLVKECARQAIYTIPQAQDKNIDIPKTKDGEDIGVGEGWWYDHLHLPPTFNTWAQVTFLHMYLLTCRLRMFPAAHAATWHQHLLDHFFFMAEDRMTTQHGMVAASMRSKYLKDLFVQWRGLMAGYDEGLVKGDAVLATAVWRNLFKAEKDVDFQGVAQVVGYIRGVLHGLEGMSDEDIAEAQISFENPTT